MRKIYLFYMIDTILDIDKFPGIISEEIIRRNNSEAALYAYTTSKKLAKRFKKERNLELFTCIEKSVTDGILEKFKEDHHDLELDIRELNTSFEKDKRVTVNTFKCIITDYEYESITLNAGTYFNEYMQDIFKYNLINNLEIFNERLKYILLEDFFLDIVHFSVTHPFEILPDSYYIFDEVGFFIRLYGNTLK